MKCDRNMGIQHENKWKSKVWIHFYLDEIAGAHTVVWHRCLLQSVHCTSFMTLFVMDTISFTSISTSSCLNLFQIKFHFLVILILYSETCRLKSLRWEITCHIKPLYWSQIYLKEYQWHINVCMCLWTQGIYECKWADIPWLCCY